MKDEMMSCYWKMTHASRFNLLREKTGVIVKKSEEKFRMKITATSRNAPGLPLPAPDSPAAVVVSGMAGRFPESSNVDEFAENLFNGVDMVTENSRRWPAGLFGIPKRMGCLEEVDKFDADFFGISQEEADYMDPGLRIMLELSYEAIIDAGVDPRSLKDTKTAVFLGSRLDSEAEAAYNASTIPDEISRLTLAGTAVATFPAHIAAFFDFHGPQGVIETACSSSLLAFQRAFDAIRNRQCDYALVGGLTISFVPQRSLAFNKLHMLSKGGACKAFDVTADGYVRSEAAIAVFLQRRQGARRIYATILHAKTNCDGYKQQGVTFPSKELQEKLMAETCLEAKLDPAEVCYVEAHGTGTKAGDPQEMHAVAEVFCKNREDPLLVGSVKSNMGHSEWASGLCGLVKLLISMERGLIPPNLHYSTPNPDITGLLDGRLKVVNKPRTFPSGGIAALNSFGFGGANVHVLLKAETKSIRDILENGSDVPRIPVLLPFSGRTSDGVQKALQKLQRDTLDSPSVAFVQGVFSKHLEGHGYRGFTIVGANENLATVEAIRSSNRPVWFCYAGLGSQWAGMASDLLKVPVFERSFRECCEALVPYAVDLYSEVTNPQDGQNAISTFKNAFIGIMAVEIALTDTLKAAGITPDGLLGHSIGEIACGYADGALSLKQTMCAAYWIARCFEEADLPEGAMLSVGLTWEEAKKRCPPHVYPACHNSVDNVTVSGSAADVMKFMEELQAEGIFARPVASGAQPMHCEKVDPVIPRLKTTLKNIIPIPKKRSSKWISTSVPEERRDGLDAEYASGCYYANNILKPVLFHEALEKVPEGAIVIEVAPHCLFQGLLTKSLGGKSCTILQTQHVKQPDNLAFFLYNLGKMYTSGGPCLNLHDLYEFKVDYPVPRGTRGMSSLIHWDHSNTWRVPTLEQFNVRVDGKTASKMTTTISLKTDSEFAYVAGHQIDGRVLFPATGYLFLVWRAIARLHGMSMNDLAIEFSDVTFNRATILNDASETVNLSLKILRAGGHWEIFDGVGKVASGTVVAQDSTSGSGEDQCMCRNSEPNLEELQLSQKEVYKELHLRGYEYGGDFAGIHAASVDGKQAFLTWCNNWVTFLDTMLQLALLSDTTRLLKVPARIRKIKVDPKRHEQFLKEFDGTTGAVASFDEDLQLAVAGGAEVWGMKTSVVPRRPVSHGSPQLEKYTFFELFPDQSVPAEKAEEGLLQVVLQNTDGSKLKFIQFGRSDPAEEDYLIVRMKKNAERLPLPVDCSVVLESAPEKPGDSYSPIGLDKVGNCAYNLLVVDDSAIDLPTQLWACVGDGGFVWIRTSNKDNVQTPNGSQNFVRIACISLSKPGKGSVIQLYRLCTIDSTNGHSESVVEINESGSFGWLETLKSAAGELRNQQGRLWLSSTETTSGIVGLTTCIRKEPGLKGTRCILASDKLSATVVEEIHSRDLAVNVVKHKGEQLYHGTFVHESLRDVDGSNLTPHAYLNATRKGDLSSLTWIESPLGLPCQAKNSTKILCKVHYAPLNFRDIMIASGKLSPDALPGSLATQECVLGLEFSGRVASSGERVMGLVPAQGLATTVLADKDFMWTVPSAWSLQEASSVPVVYATAYYALIMRGRLRHGESVLIHSGSGGVGQAAIGLALSMNCRVFTTVGSEAKREFLKQKFPELNDSSFGNSRDALAFESWIMRETQGRGVDVALNSLSGDKLTATLRCVAEHGRFLEIGKADLSQNKSLGMSVFLRNIAFHGILLDAIFDKETEKKELVRLIKNGIDKGVVRPLPVTIFAQDDAESAFRFMSRGKHVGKVVLEIQSDETSNVPVMVHAERRLYCRPEAVYLITGGLGGFGLELAHWLFTKGARNLVLTSRSGIKTAFQKRAIANFEAQGGKVVVSTTRVESKEGAEKLIAECSSIGPLAGVFHLAAVLKDGLLENQSSENFKAVYEAKASGFVHLDQVTRSRNLAVDWFVAFSSVSCGRGNAGQTNYGLANSVLERVCERRKDDGLAGLAIQWGAIGDVGMVQETFGDNKNIVIGGTIPQRIRSCLTTLEKLLCMSRESSSPAVVASTVWATGQEASSSATSATKGDVFQKIANVLGLSRKAKVNEDMTLESLGMDSLMAVEVGHLLEKEFNLTLDSTKVRNLTFAGIKNLDASG